MSKRVVMAMAEDIKEALTAPALMKVLVPLFHIIALQGKQEGTIADKEMINPMFSFGELRSVGGFWKVEWVVNEIVASICARFSAKVCGGNVLDQIEDPEDLHMLVHATDDVQLELIPLVMEYCTKNFVDVPVNQEAQAALHARLLSPASQQEVMDEVLGQIAAHMLGRLLGGSGIDPEEVAEMQREFAAQPDQNHKPTLH